MISKGLVCPHCRKENPIVNDGFLFDEDLNILCVFCEEVIYPTTEEAEQTLKHVTFTTGHMKKEPVPIKPLGESEIILCETNKCCNDTEQTKTESFNKQDFVEGLA